MRLVEPKAGSSNGELRQLNSRPGVGSLSPIGPQYFHHALVFGRNLLVLRECMTRKVLAATNQYPQVLIYCKSHESRLVPPNRNRTRLVWKRRTSGTKNEYNWTRTTWHESQLFLITYEDYIAGRQFAHTKHTTSKLSNQELAWNRQRGDKQKGELSRIRRTPNTWRYNFSHLI